MAVQIDIPAFRDSLPADTLAAADKLVESGSVEELEAVDGGAQALVSEGGQSFEPWVGVADRSFGGECDCGTDEDLCAHAAAVALAAFASGIKFSAAPAAPEPDDEFLRAARSLSPQQLIDLVVDQAAEDPEFADLLLAAADGQEPNDIRS
jgi:uncharacterized Zn finger protein